MNRITQNFYSKIMLYPLSSWAIFKSVLCLVDWTINKNVIVQSSAIGNIFNKIIDRPSPKCPRDVLNYFTMLIRSTCMQLDTYKCFIERKCVWFYSEFKNNYVIMYRVVKLKVCNSSRDGRAHGVCFWGEHISDICIRLCLKPSSKGVSQS